MEMSYQSPIDIIISKMNMQMDGEIFKAVQNVGVNVDRDELLKALQYDRGQYQKGYTDRDSEIVRCKDCKHKVDTVDDYDYESKCPCYCSGDPFYSWVPDDDWFCADGKKRENK